MVRKVAGKDRRHMERFASSARQSLHATGHLAGELFGRSQRLRRVGFHEERDFAPVYGHGLGERLERVDHRTALEPPAEHFQPHAPCGVEIERTGGSTGRMERAGHFGEGIVAHGEYIEVCSG